MSLIKRGEVRKYMNKRILFSLVSICSVVGMVGGTALAAFTSTASNAGNTFGSGSLTLSINTALGSLSTPVFTVTNAAPGDVTPVQTLDLKNEGSVTATTVNLTSIGLTGNALLADNLTLDLTVDTNNSGVLDAGDTTTTGHLSSAATWTNVPVGSLAGGANRKVFAKITFDAAAPNTVQGVSAGFSFNFLASQ